MRGAARQLDARPLERAAAKPKSTAGSLHEGPRQGALPAVHQGTRRRRRGHSVRESRPQEDWRVIGAILTQSRLGESHVELLLQRRPPRRLSG